jgi:hypothetical protein
MASLLLSDLCGVSVMIYALTVLTFVMLAYMFWSTTFSLRRDRIRAMRRAGRSAAIASRRPRVR